MATTMVAHWQAVMTLRLRQVMVECSKKNKNKNDVKKLMF
jgi:hypothetical protein